MNNYDFDKLPSEFKEAVNLFDKGLEKEGYNELERIFDESDIDFSVLIFNFIKEIYDFKESLPNSIELWIDRELENELEHHNNCYEEIDEFLREKMVYLYHGTLKSNAFKSEGYLIARAGKFVSDCYGESSSDLEYIYATDKLRLDKTFNAILYRNNFDKKTEKAFIIEKGLIARLDSSDFRRVNTYYESKFEPNDYVNDDYCIIESVLVGEELYKLHIGEIELNEVNWVPYDKWIKLEMEKGYQLIKESMIRLFK